MEHTGEPMSTIKLEDGKYTVHHNNGRIEVDRYSDPNWRNCTGDGFVLALIQKIEDLHETIDDLRSRIEFLEDSYD